MSDALHPESSSTQKEEARLAREILAGTGWRHWGPYLSERQWGTVREDYSADGDAWNYFTFDQSRSRAYRWGEDGIAGFSDHHQRLCIAHAFWNHQDPIIKERLFGLNNAEGNHGEDVKELYYYLDATPTHSYLKYLYKLPQRPFPYQQLRHESQSRSRKDPEFELPHTGIFNDNKYFDIFIEYAKSSTHDFFLKITAHNRSNESAPLDILPHIWFRNTWSWKTGEAKPHIQQVSPHQVLCTHEQLGQYYIYAQEVGSWLFTENESNPAVFNQPEPSGYYKDGICNYICKNDLDAVNPAQLGTKAAFHFRTDVPGNKSVSCLFRISQRHYKHPFDNAESTILSRAEEAESFYKRHQENLKDPEEKRIHRQALAGMIWNKQFYHYQINPWLEGDPNQPPPPAERKHGRNWQWPHLDSANILSMPDKWEFPWFASWDLAFHAIPLASIDPDFAKNQLKCITREWFLHPNGQLPAYEWDFSDVNPPVHAWATWEVYNSEKLRNHGQGDLPFLESVFHKLLLNFTWWVNREDKFGRNVFQGGFLGLDNIGVFDRSSELPTGGHIDQADGTSWMAMYALNMLRISLELAQYNSTYEDIATKFFEHFLMIAGAMNNIAETDIGLWDEQDKFFYDVLNLPDGQMFPLRVRSMVGLIPLFAVEVLEPELLRKVPGFTRRLEWFLNHRPDLAGLISRWNEPGRGERRLLSLLRGHRMKCLLRRMLDPNEFLSPYGIRSLSKYHETHPYEFTFNNSKFNVHYLPGESDSGLFGGNSNWRGPIWFPVNYLIIQSLHRFHSYYGDDFLVEAPTGSGNFITLKAIAHDLTNRLCSIFKKDAEGNRPVFHNSPIPQNDPHFTSYIHFNEYFHGDTAQGLGASHQTGWTGLVATLLTS